MAELKTYYVRSLTLQKEVMDEDGTKSLQPYKSGSKVELTENEAQRYRHLVESEEQHNSRQKGSKTLKK